MGVAEDFARTPCAMERAASSCDQGNGTLAVPRFPSFEIVIHREHISIRPGQAVEICNDGSRWRPEWSAIAVENDSGEFFEPVHSAFFEPRDQRCERMFAFIDADD